MGSSSSHSERPVHEQDPPVGVLPQYVHPYQITLRLKEKLSWSGDDFSVKDTAGRLYFKIAGRAFSLREKKVLLDPQMQPILNIRHSLTSFNGKYMIYAGDKPDQKLFNVKAHFTFGSADMQTDFINASDGQTLTIHIRGDFFHRNAEITLGGLPIARVTREFMNSGELLFGNQTYFLTVAPGVDLAMMVAICICLDENNSDR